MSGHAFEVGDVITYANGAEHIIAPRVYGDPDWVLRVYDPREGVTYRVGRGADLSPVVVMAEHVGRRARITNRPVPTEFDRHRGRITKWHDGTYRETGSVGITSDDGSHYVAAPGCAVLVADEPTPAAESVEEHAPEPSLIAVRADTRGPARSMAVFSDPNGADEAIAATQTLAARDVEAARLTTEVERLHGVIADGYRDYARLTTERDDTVARADQLAGVLGGVELALAAAREATLDEGPGGTRFSAAWGADDARTLWRAGQRGLAARRKQNREEAAKRDRSAAEATPTVDEAQIDVDEKQLRAIIRLYCGGSIGDNLALDRLAAAARAARTGDDRG